MSQILLTKDNQNINNNILCQGITFKISNRKLARPTITTLHIKLHSNSNTHNLLFSIYSLNAFMIFFYFVTFTVPQISLTACLSVRQFHSWCMPIWGAQISLTACLSVRQFHSWRMPISGVQSLVLKKVFFWSFLQIKLCWGLNCALLPD